MRLSLAVALLALVACRMSPAQASPPEDAGAARRVDWDAEDFPMPTLPKGRVVIPGAGGAHAVDVEVAATPLARARGLMWRRQLEEGQGMLFIFPDEAVQSFWMKNTLIPLDMAFITSAGAVVGVVENAEPRTLISRTVGRPSRYVLEVPGGWSRKVGLKEGITVQLVGVVGMPVE